MTRLGTTAGHLRWAGLLVWIGAAAIAAITLAGLGEPGATHHRGAALLAAASLALAGGAVAARRSPAWPVGWVALTAAATSVAWTTSLSTVLGAGTHISWAVLHAVLVALITLILAGFGAQPLARAAAPLLALSPAALWVEPGVAAPSNALGLAAVGLALLAAGRPSARWYIPLSVLSGFTLAGAALIAVPALWWGIAILGVYFHHRRAQLDLITGAATVLPLALLDAVHAPGATIAGAAIGPAANPGQVIAAVVIAVGAGVIPALRGAKPAAVWPLLAAGCAVALAGVLDDTSTPLQWLPALVVVAIAAAAAPRPRAAPLVVWLGAAAAIGTALLIAG